MTEFLSNLLSGTYCEFYDRQVTECPSSGNVFIFCYLQLQQVIFCSDITFTYLPSRCAITTSCNFIWVSISHQDLVTHPLIWLLCLFIPETFNTKPKAETYTPHCELKLLYWLRLREIAALHNKWKCNKTNIVKNHMRTVFRDTKKENNKLRKMRH